MQIILKMQLSSVIDRKATAESLANDNDNKLPTSGPYRVTPRVKRELVD